MDSPAGFSGRRWIELALDYRCNLRCLGCHACNDTGERLSTEAAVAILRSARARGVDKLWLGGGEPTLRTDLLGLVRLARRVGYREVTLQTNGMRLAYEHYRSAAIAAGITEVRLNVKSHRAEVHDRLSGGERCHAYLLEALAGLATMEVRRVADVLLTRTTAADLPETVAFFAERGIQSFDLGLFSAADSAAPEVAAEVPRFGELAPHIAAALACARRLGVAISSLHTPPCTLTEELRELYAPTRELSLVVVGPDARPFALEDSPFEGGAYTTQCAACSERARCGGPRADYVKLHGAGEFVAISRRPNALPSVPG